MISKIWACSSASRRSRRSLMCSFRARFICWYCWIGRIQAFPRPSSSVGLDCRNIHHNLAHNVFASLGNRGRDLWSQPFSLLFCLRRTLVGLHHRPEFPEHHDASVSLLKPGTDYFDIKLIPFLSLLKLRISDVKVARKKHLERRNLCVNPDLTFEDNGHTNHLSGMRHTYIRLELDRVIQSTFD